MKIKYILLSLFFVSAECNAVFTSNECDKKADIERFSKLYEIEIKEYEFEKNESHQAWFIKIPTKYKKFKFDNIFLVLNQNDKEVLRTQVETGKENEYILGYIDIHKKLEKNIKVYAEYNEHPGVEIFDGSICRFELDKKHKKAALRANGLKRYAFKKTWIG